MNYLLVFPMAAMVLLSSVIFFLMVTKRVRAVKNGQIPIKYYRTFAGSIELPEQMIQLQNHYKNIFEAPVLFYVGCLVAMVLPVQGPLVLVMAWGYVFLRICHAYIHVGKNDVRTRALSFGLSWLFLWGLWVLDVLAALRLTVG